MNPTTFPERKPVRVRRFVLVGLLGVLVLCLGIAAVLFTINASAPSASAAPDRLSAEQIALVEEALHLRTELGDSVWPGFGQAQIPLLIYNETNAFLCAHPQPPAGWQGIEGPAVNGQPCSMRTWADGQNFTLPVGDLWAGSLVSREWGLIELKTMMEDQFPPPLGRLVSVPMSREMLSPGRYLGGLVHESFHAHQATIARPAFDEAERAYPDGKAYWQADLAAHDAWEQEIDALYRAVRSESDEAARQLARQFLELRQSRRSQFSMPKALVRYEQRFEWLEGMAKYVELGMLRVAAASPDYDMVSAVSGLDGFNGYGFIDRYWDQGLSQVKRQATAEGDTRFYYTGWLQGLLLDRFSLGWKEQVMQGAWLEDLLAEAISN